MLKVALRACLIAVIIIVHLGSARTPCTDYDLRQTTIRTSRWARRACRTLGLRVRRTGDWPARGGRLLVANHLSWLDPLLLSAIRPAIFVTSVETAEDSFLGRICASAGCVFMERRHRSGLIDECGRLATLLRHHAVVVFPEATSSDGTRLLPFRPAAFAAAIAARAPVQPLTLQYHSLDGRALNARTRDRVYWYGDMTFLPHLGQLTTIARIDATLTVMPVHTGIACRKALANQTRLAIGQALGLLSSPAADRHIAA